MVFIGDKKYACETCIKGHRSSSCKHTDRPLFEIKKKGRPVTQCEHCRELRKTRQIHVKCVCEGKDNGEGPSSSGLSGQGVAKVLARAAFPGGLPEGLLEASVASRPLSEGSDSDQGRGCSCKDDTSCTCWTPRSHAKRPMRPAERRGSESHPRSTPGEEPISQPAALVVHAHSGNNRPVLPKPPVERPISPSHSAHTSSAPILSRGRSPSHGNHGQAFYTPYPRPLEFTRGVDSNYGPQSQSPSQYPPSNSGYLQSEGYSRNADTSQNSASFDDWPDGDQSMFQTPDASPPLCNCGSTCACPGCLEHNGPNTDPTAACVNPNSCSACLECNILALTSLASDIAQPTYDPTQVPNVDDWLRQVASMPDFGSSSLTSASAFSPSSPGQLDMRFDPSVAQSYRAWNDPRTTQAFSPLAESECCGGRCQCPTGICSCPPDCCGCCQGCSCSSCNHDSGSGRTLTFATSGERASCCGGRSHGDASSGSSMTAGPSPRRASDSNLPHPSFGSTRLGEGSWLSQLLAVPRETDSRGSSISSLPSPTPSIASSPGPHASAGDAPQEAPADRSCCASVNNASIHHTTTHPSGSSSGIPPQQPGPGRGSSRNAGYHNTRTSIDSHGSN
ncbi:hypothetical protein C8Q79DRAFT_451642 [Trametes meyenii]|nr:hypothetical protein C8Q79DRAFT_451642 [Trametes meyenii]